MNPGFPILKVPQGTPGIVGPENQGVLTGIKVGFPPWIHDSIPKWFPFMGYYVSLTQGELLLNK